MNKWKSIHISMVAAMGALVLGSASCRRAGNDAAWHSRERERIELQQHLRLLSYRFESRGGHLTAELNEALERNERDQRSLAELRKQVDSLAQEITDLDSQLEQLAVENARKARAKAAGMRFDQLEAASGRTYQDVTVTQVTDGSVALRHRSGTARLRASDLTSEQRTLFGVSTEAAMREARVEASQARAYEEHLQAAAASAEPARERRSARSRISSRVNSAIASRSSRNRDSNRPLAQPARTVGSGSVYRVRRSSRPRYYSVYSYNPYSYGGGYPLRTFPERPGNIYPR